MNIIRSVLAFLVLLAAYSYSEATRKLIKEGEKVYAVYYDFAGAEAAREECEIPKNLEVSLTTLSYSPYYGITSKLISGGIPDGVVKVLDEDGVLRLQETYLDGKRNGETKSYFKSGKVSSESTYTDGNLNGKLIAYSRDGKIASEVNFLNGELLNGNVYGMEATKEMNIGELLGRFAEKRRLSGKKVLVVANTETKEAAKELKTLLSERGADVVVAGSKKKINEGDKGADIMVEEAEYAFYDILVFIFCPATAESNKDMSGILEKFYSDDKIIAAVGDGEAVLARAGLLVSRVAAKPEKEGIEYELSKIQNLTFKEGVVVSDRIVTASDAKLLKELVSEIAKLVKNE